MTDRLTTPRRIILDDDHRPPPVAPPAAPSARPLAGYIGDEPYVRAVRTGDQRKPVARPLLILRPVTPAPPPRLPLGTSMVVAGVGLEEGALVRLGEDGRAYPAASAADAIGIVQTTYSDGRVSVAGKRF